VNELIALLHRRGTIWAHTVKTARNLVLPALAVFIFVRFILELPQDNTSARLVASVFWIVLLYTALGAVNDLVFSNKGDNSWRERVPKLFADLLRVGLVAIGAMIIYSSVWGREIRGALTALGVGSVVIGLALQEPLGNIVSGLMLLFERPLKVGDWISAEGVTGKVIEINWRSVHIQTPTRELRIVPNVRLYKGAFSNLSRPTDVRTDSFLIGFSYDDAPNRVKGILEALVSTTPGVLTDPAPVVRTAEYSDYSISYKVNFSVARQEELAATKDRIMTRLWYVVRREGLTIPFPITMEYSPGENPGAPQRSPQEWLREHPRFKSAVESGSAKQPLLVDYCKGEFIQRSGKRFKGFALILAGKANLIMNDQHGHEMQIGEIGPGECFGEHMTTGTGNNELEIVALEDVKVIVFDSAEIRELFSASPGLAAEIGDAIEARRVAAKTSREARQELKRPLDVRLP
jgi:small-conductance mechanosensitive channel/CRP-like cAMP-binding protein